MRYFDTNSVMKEKNTIILLLLFISRTLYGGVGEIYNKGLHFRSFEVDQDKRTNLNLTPNHPLTLENGFSLEFEIQLRKEEQNFGYVFRIIGNDTENIDLLADVASNEYLFSLVSANKSIIRFKKNEITNFKIGSWTRVQLFYNFITNEIVLTIDKESRKVHFTSSNFKKIKVSFGRNNNPLFATTDVPPMTIRDIRVFDSKHKLARYWKLDKHTADGVNDECIHDKAVCSNPTWEIDNQVRWQHKIRLILPYAYPQIAFDGSTGRVFIVKEKHITIYNSESGQLDSLIASKGEAFNCMSNQLVFDESHHKLISYSFDNKNLAQYNFYKNEWSNSSNERILPYFWHHSKCIIPEDSILVTAGGYGFHKYNGIIMEYSFLKKEWKKNDISKSIPPRYLGSLGYFGNSELLYFGGYGSESGNQDEFPRNYYDLYKINIKTLKVKKVWELNVPNENFTTGNSMVINKGKNTFYVLKYPNSKYSSMIKVYEFSIGQPNFREVGDSIPYKFSDVESYCDLFFCPKTSQLVAVTAVLTNGKTDLNVYTIAYPPLQKIDVLQEENNAYWKWYFLLILILPASIIFIVLKKSKQHRLENIEQITGNYNLDITENELKPSSINLLGAFQVIDKDGINITGGFTQTLTQIIVLILLYTIKNGQGISSQELTDILWYDKDSESARNNRNVNLNKLRLLLKKVGCLELVNSNSYWSIHIDKEITCDYKSVMFIIDLINKQKVENLEIINEFLSISSRGVLLPNMQYGWLDNFKGNYTNSVVEILLELSHKEMVKSNYGLLLRISEVILLLDNIEEDAARLKVYSLFNLGKKGQSKQFFEKFLDDYKSLMGVEIKDSFDQFRNISL